MYVPVRTNFTALQGQSSSRKDEASTLFDSNYPPVQLFITNLNLIASDCSSAV